MSTTPDVFEALRAATDPIAPAEAFAARLHQQLRNRLEEPMTATTHPDTPAHAPTVHSLMPYLVVDGAADALAFYAAAFGAVEHHRLVGDDGRVGHAELSFGRTRVSLADEHPEYGILGPVARGGTSTVFQLDVDDADAVFARALAHGATELRPVTDQFHGHRRGVLRDPWGHEWGISAPIAGFDEAQYVANSRELGFDVQLGAEPTSEFDTGASAADRGGEADDDPGGHG